MLQGHEGALGSVTEGIISFNETGFQKGNKITMSLFEITENDKRIFETELKDFLPDEIFDVHAHVWLKSMDRRKAVEGAEKRTVTWPSLVAQDNSIEDYLETNCLLFPGKKVSALIFANEGESEGKNDYVAEAAKRAGFPALYFSRPELSADEIEERIREKGFIGIKSYLDLAPKYIPEGEIRVFDFFPKHQLERINRMKGIVMLHIPRSGRLKDPVNIAQIAEIKELYPDIKLIIAHIGRAYTHNDIGDAFETLDRYPSLYYDFTANCCEYAIHEAIKHAGPEHVMYGSDMPILRMRTHRIEENNTYINLVPPGLYGDPSQDPHLREVSPAEAEKITFFAYEELLAFKRAALSLGLSRREIKNILCDNAKNLTEQARIDIYGK